MAKARKKKRTHLKTSKKLSDDHIPKSMVIRTEASNVGSSISQLTRDIRRMMEPHTAIRLKERKSNKLRDYIAMTGPLGVTHLLLLSKTKSGPNMRIVRTPHGPTLHFRIKTYSLCKDIIKTQKRPKSPGSEFLVPPLLILNNFVSEKKDLPHEALLTSTFCNMFPELSVQKTRVSCIKRVLLLHRDSSKDYINLRHYAIVTKNISVSQSIRKVSTNLYSEKRPLPNLGHIKDISEYILHNIESISYESDLEIDDNMIVEIKEKNNSENNPEEKVQKKIVELIELGPRLQLDLYKITEGISAGKILFHKKDLEEIEKNNQTSNSVEENFPSTDNDVDIEILNASTEELINRTKLIENDIKEHFKKCVMRSEYQRLIHEQKTMEEKIKDNEEKIKNNKQLPYLVGNIVEILDMDPMTEMEEGANVDLDAARKGKSAVIKTSTRQTIFLPLIGLVESEKLKPGDLIGVNKDSYLILDTLPTEYDSRVKAMEVDEKPMETYSDIGGLDKQIEELVEAVVLPMKQADKFKSLGIRPPKGKYNCFCNTNNNILTNQGALMYGPPGTGKTLLARACAAQTNATFLKLAAPQLVQMFIGDGAKLVRDAFSLAKEKAPAIIFIDELDAIGTKRFDSDKSGDREVQRTMLELLNQLDGFSSDERVKVLAATNRVDTLDPALLRSGRLDRKIEFPLPNEEARAGILQIHSRKMTIDNQINWNELARSTDEYNGAMLKSVCVEAGMIALRQGETKISHENFADAVNEVMMRKKTISNFYA
ncbi:hypothetical protein PORY_002092 [Pneumocystis oryctolagi]|uniref:Uncharacterized protein n=1 Tax=Pneumocystis oryctolagi TaxID=42067 RepID=A0ACB7C9K4_9ASCO|nr:hypothetical protein PORY_002092 [Pneumocystis oryctolagi]